MNLNQLALSIGQVQTYITGNVCGWQCAHSKEFEPKYNQQEKETSQINKKICTINLELQRINIQIIHTVHTSLWMDSWNPCFRFSKTS